MRTSSAVAVFALLFALSTLVRAQDSLQEDIALTVGDILEILPANSFANPVHSWILTQDRTFLQAARTPSFRYRFIQPGSYSLIAEIRSGDGTQSVRRTFSISTRAREAGDVVIGSAPVTPVTTSNTELSGIVKLDPPMDQNARVILPDHHLLLKLSPLSMDTKPLSLDLDTTVDADLDGNPGNDVQNQGTFFQLYAEPLMIWFTEPLQSRSLSVTTVDPDGNARIQRIDVLSTNYASQQGMVLSPVRITSIPGENGSVSFSATTGTAQQPNLLYQWNFGDGQESLIMNPTHTYAEDGTYTVTLEVKNLIDGQEVAKDTQQLTVTGAGAGSATSSIPSEERESTESSFLSKLPIMSLLTGLGVFALFVVIGIGAVSLLSRLRGGRTVDQTFADMEKAISSKQGSVNNPPALVIPATTATIPQKPASPTPTQEDLSKREENSASHPPAADTPRIDEKAAPAWLKKGLGASSKPAATHPAPAPAPTAAPRIRPAAPVPTPSPVPHPAPKPSTPAPAAPVPSWLQTPVPPTTPAARKPQSAPSPQPPASAPKPSPVQAPAASSPSTPKPVAPVAAPIPTTAPKPVMSVPVSPLPQPVPPVTASAPLPTAGLTPKPAPVVPPTPTPPPAPLPTSARPPMPTQINPAPAPVVSLPSKPSPQNPVPPPSAVTPPAAIQTASAVSPTEAVSEPRAPSIPADTPIAIIRAESLEKPEDRQS